MSDPIKPDPFEIILATPNKEYVEYYTREMIKNYEEHLKAVGLGRGVINDGFQNFEPEYVHRRYVACVRWIMENT